MNNIAIEHIQLVGKYSVLLIICRMFLFISYILLYVHDKKKKKDKNVINFWIYSFFPC